MKDQIGKDGNRVEKDTVYRDREAEVDNKVSRETKETRDGKVLVGVFGMVEEAVEVIKRLKESGYREDEITLVVKDDEKLERIEDEVDVDVEAQGFTEKVAGGAAIGGTLGGLYAALPALGLVTVPGIGPILAAGPIAGVLGGIVAGSVTGGLIGALVELGVDEEDAKNYEYLVEEGKILILVENREDLRDDAYMAFRQNNTLVGGRNW
ncbi:general stress protein [Gudongella sp. DL1XJH-153]|uniref:general stress protein n=1 Tax=Gudongella sp. DL1XJH-153 TaxID=3409804 RepID=UPI003BB4BF82